MCGNGLSMCRTWDALSTVFVGLERRHKLTVLAQRVATTRPVTARRHHCPIACTPADTMRCFLPTLAQVALFGYTVSATPVVPVATSGEHRSIVSPLHAHRLRQRPDMPVPGRNFADVESQQEFPRADILVCPDSTCTNCTVFRLEGRPLVNDCLGDPTPFNSVAVFQPRHHGSPSSWGPLGCQQVTQVPAVNECFTVCDLIDTFNFVLRKSCL